jgi:hypothetical protein
MDMNFIPFLDGRNGQFYRKDDSNMFPPRHWCTPTTRANMNKLRVCESRVLRIIFGSKGAEVIGGWRRLHTEELHNWYSLPYIIKMFTSRMEWAVHVASI